MIVAMKVKTAAEVPGSKKLRVYTFEAPGMEDLTIVANQTNVYQVDDLAAVATVGTKLQDLEITQRKLFGIESFGMALGPTEGPIGRIFTAEEFVLE